MLEGLLEIQLIIHMVVELNLLNDLELLEVKQQKKNKITILICVYLNINLQTKRVTKTYKISYIAAST